MLRLVLKPATPAARKAAATAATTAATTASDASLALLLLHIFSWLLVAGGLRLPVLIVHAYLQTPHAGKL